MFPARGQTREVVELTFISVTPDQLASAGSYISHEWGDYGYRVEAIETRTFSVSVFRVCASDGARFAVITDKWGNCRYLDTHNSDAGLDELVADMHAKARPNG